MKIKGLFLIFMLCLSASIQANAAKKLPPVPKAALEDYSHAGDMIDMLLRQSDKGAGTGQWDEVIDCLTKAHKRAPDCPQILHDLGLANTYRGRNLAAIAWYCAAEQSIHKYAPGSKQEKEVQEQIVTLNQKVDDKVALLIAFAKSAIHYIHTKQMPSEPSGVNIYWPIEVSPPAGPMFIQLPNGEWVKNPDLENYQPPDIPERLLARYLLELRFGMGDIKAIEDLDAYCRQYYPDIANQEEVLRVRAQAYHILYDVYANAGNWRDATNLAYDAAKWCESEDGHFTSASYEAEKFWKLRNESRVKMAEDKPSLLRQYLTLAYELSKSDDEVYLDAKVEQLRHATSNQNVSILEGIAKIIQPITINHIRLRAVTGVKYVMGLDGR